MSSILIGISGWTYPPWRKAFYPEDLPQRRELEYASRAVTSIEINGTFYGSQKPASYRKWREATPDDFVFSIKASRYITHERKLKEVEKPLANFLATGLFELGPKLGPILWQFPPSFQYDEALIENFLRQLPHDTDAASELAGAHDDSVTDVLVTSDTNRQMRHAMEVRHPSFENEEFIGLLRKYGVALVIADTAGKWPFMEDVTADFVYLRLHGDAELYASGYTDEALDNWARKVRRWAAGGSPRGVKLNAPAAKPRKSGRDVYVYFDNDIKVRAPFDAMSLARRLNLEADGSFKNTPPPLP